MRSILSVLMLSLSLGACASGAGPHGGMPMPTPAAAQPPTPTVTAATPVEEGLDFAVYRSDGTPSSFDEMMSAARESEAILLGEQHNDPVTHQVQYRILVEAHRRLTGAAPNVHPPRAATERAPAPSGGRPVVLSLEMFERDVQLVIDEYLADMITESAFEAASRPWGNWETDYKPIFEYARVHGIEVVAANAPRRYVNRASRMGRAALEDLPEEAFDYLPPLPYPEPSEAYLAEWNALMGDAMQHMQGSPIDAQALWDASMAYAVAQTLDAEPEALVIHLTGAFHVQNGTGTPEVLQHYRPGTRALVVSMRPVGDPGTFDPEQAGLGDFVVLTRAPGAPPAP